MEDFKELLDHDDPKADCPFCPVQEKYDNPDSKCKKENDSDELGKNLSAKGDKPSDHIAEIFTLTSGIHGQYTVNPHHLISGGEILGEQEEIQSYLCKEGRYNGKLQPCDTGYNVNNANNGIWLPSTPAMYKQTVSIETVLRKEREAGVESEYSIYALAANFDDYFEDYVAVFGDKLKELGLNTDQPWIRMKDPEQDDIAAVVMMQYKRQFHLGQHNVIDKAEASYVKIGIKHLDTLTTYLDHYSNKCPMEEDGTTKDSPPYKPPMKLNGYLDILSIEMKGYITGEPKEWKYFISKWAWRLTEKLN